MSNAAEGQYESDLELTTDLAAWRPFVPWKRVLRVKQGDKPDSSWLTKDVRSRVRTCRRGRQNGAFEFGLMKGTNASG